MNSKNLRRCLGVVLLLALATGLPAQAPAAPKIDFPAPSPASTLKQRVGLTDIEIVYSRPGVKDRQIFGGIVPYGKVWRTGANSATKISFSTAVKFGGISIPAGEYALFTIPDQKEWTIIINKVTGQWGAYSYDSANDLLRVKATVTALSSPVETFTIDLNDLRNESATLNLIWEKTRVSVPLQVDVVTALVPQIEAAMASGAAIPDGTYYNAAAFYFDQGVDLKKAKEWIVRATNNPKPAFFMVHLKAKILARLGEKDAATAAAKQSTELAIAAEGPQSGFVKMNNDLIASLR
jgi:Protein of unknown function (DUF2911)